MVDFKKENFVNCKCFYYVKFVFFILFLTVIYSCADENPQEKSEFPSKDSNITIEEHIENIKNSENYKSIVRKNNPGAYYINKETNPMFRSYEWGKSKSELLSENVTELKDFFGDESCVRTFYKNNENLNIGKIKLEEIKYYFFNNMLGRISLHGNWDSYYGARESLILKYGQYTTSQYHNSIWWNKGDIKISLLEYFGENFAITYEVKQIMDKFKKCERNIKKNNRLNEYKKKAELNSSEIEQL